MISLVVTFFLCLFLSAFLAGAEMAFVSANRIKIRDLADSGNHDAKSLMQLYKHPQSFLSAVLIANNAVNIMATTIMAYFFSIELGIKAEWVTTVVMLPILVVFGEAVPKDYCRIKSLTFLKAQAFWLVVIDRVFHIPVRMMLSVMEKVFPFAKNKDAGNMFVNEEEFRALISESAKKGIVEPHEETYIHMILDFENTKVKSVMTPLAQVPKLNFSGTVEDIKEIARQKDAKMVLVYEEVPSIVMGMVYVFDVLCEAEENEQLNGYLRSPIFVNEQQSLENVFLILQKKRQSYAVVVDDDNEVVGAVAIEKLLMGTKNYSV